jgi:hypothetical protein
MDGEVPDELTDWQGRPWKKGSTEKAAHPNSRFTAPASNNPVHLQSREYNDPEGVPISAIIFGGRRATTIPLVLQSFNWVHGVYLGAMLGSRPPRPRPGKVGVVRRDPMAMLPFCGYDMGDYFAHWLSMRHDIESPPEDLPGQLVPQGRQRQVPVAGLRREHARAQVGLDRAHGRVGGRETPIGWVPRPGTWTSISRASTSLLQHARAQRPEGAQHAARADVGPHRVHAQRWTAVPLDGEVTAAKGGARRASLDERAAALAVASDGAGGAARERTRSPRSVASPSSGEEDSVSAPAAPDAYLHGIDTGTLPERTKVSTSNPRPQSHSIRRLKPTNNALIPARSNAHGQNPCL